MLDKRHLTCQLHVLTLLNQQMLYGNVRTCSRGFNVLLLEQEIAKIVPSKQKKDRQSEK